MSDEKDHINEELEKRIKKSRDVSSALKKMLEELEKQQKKRIKKDKE